MRVYNYHPATKEFICEEEAKLDPLESAKQRQAVFLLPAYATTEPPPEAAEGFARCFINGEWKQVEDHRGKSVYSIEDAAEGVVENLGPIQSSHYTMLRPAAFTSWNSNLKMWVVDEYAKTEAEKEEWNATIRMKLAEVDAKSIRALRAGEVDWIKKYEEEATALRAEIKK